MKFFEGAKVKIKSLNIQGTVQKVLPFDRYSVRIRRPLTNHAGQPLMAYNGRQRFTVETHNIAEIDMDLSRSYNDGTANSDRGLTTLEAMEVDPETVTMVFIKKVKEIHDVTANWLCDVCKGIGHMRVPQALADAHAVPVVQSHGWNDSVRDLQGNELGKVSYASTFTWQNTCLVKCAGGCEKLKNVRGFGLRAEAYGKLETRPTEVTVYYPQWTPGVKFDSRFRHGSSVHEQCHLCSKAIPSGRLVAVEGRDSKQKAHGLYIGTDCAKKFTGYNIEFEPLDGTSDIIVKIA